jgi:hypothetical protein
MSRAWRGDFRGRYWGEDWVSLVMRSRIARMVKMPRMPVGRVRTGLELVGKVYGYL